MVGISPAVAGSNVNQAFRWSEDAGIEDLGTLGGNGSAAWGINSQGDVVGWSLTAADAMVATLWKLDGIILNLGGPPGTTWASANDINDSRQVVGRGGSPIRPFLWTEMGGQILLPGLGDGTLQAAPEAINGRGEIIGNGRTPEGHFHVILWQPRTPAERVTDLADGIAGLIADGLLTHGQGTALLAKLGAALDSLDQGNPRAATGQLSAFINHLEDLVQTGEIPASVAGPLLEEARHLVATMEQG